MFVEKCRVRYIEQRVKQRSGKPYPVGYWTGTVIKVKNNNVTVKWDAVLPKESDIDTYDADQLELLE